MKRQWPREVTFVEQGAPGWANELPPGERKSMLHKWVSKGKHRSHKRERAAGRREARRPPEG